MVDRHWTGEEGRGVFTPAIPAENTGVKEPRELD
jgi:hypothetical protein